MIKHHLVRALTLCVFAYVSLATQAALLQTPENIPLSVPAASVAAGGIPGSTNLAGTSFIMSAVVSATSRDGSASLINTQQWVRQFGTNNPSLTTAPRAITVRSDGSIVITGSADSYAFGYTNGYNFLTLSYAADGTPLWTNLYDGPSHGDDIPYYIAAGTNGNVWVTGQSMRYATNSGLTDVALVCYAGNGIPLWTNRYMSGMSNQDFPTSLDVDGSGNAYLKLTSGTAPSNGLGEVIGQALIKYDPLGNPLWTNIFAGAQGLVDVDVAVDPAGNLFLGGMGGRTVGASGKELVKLAPDGTPLWTNQQVLDFRTDFDSIQCDSKGDVIVTGETYTNNLTEYVVTKCSSATGTTLWTNTMDAQEYDGGNMPQTFVTPAGDVLLVGGATGSPFLGGAYQIMKFDTNGVPVWTNLNVNFGTNSEIYGATADNAGEVYLTADALDATNSTAEFATTKYSSSGQPLWTNFYDGSSGQGAGPSAVGVNGMGEVFVAGSSGSVSTTIAYADALTYLPPTDYTGLDTIKYTLTDAFGSSAAGSVQVLVGGTNFELLPVGFGLSGFQLAVAGAPGTNVVIIQASTDFVHWQPLSTNAPVLGAVQYTDPSASAFAQRFYRAEQLP